MQVPHNEFGNQETNATSKVWPYDQDNFIERLKANDCAAFKFLYSHYAAALYGTILRSVKDELLARSILEQTFIQVRSSISTYDGLKMKLFTWINQISRKLILNN